MNKTGQTPVMESQELTDDIEIIGPGQMLAEGRTALSLTQEQVADKLNFRISLVKDIENDIFDKSLPSTFNRGYLRNFAKLVNVAEEDVLASYEMLNVAEKQSAEMQSFSKRTKRQAENSILKWITYLIVALVLGSTLVWFFQDTSKLKSNNSELPSTPLANQSTETVNAATKATAALTPLGEANIESTPLTITRQLSEEANEELNNTASSATPEAVETTNAEDNTTEAVPVTLKKTSVTFSFLGDCWVNIYDATGERLAWGVKKTDYVMQIEGVAPFTVTLGKPELVAIHFNGDDINMNQFNQGNIAKFTLPLAVN